MNTSPLKMLGFTLMELMVSMALGLLITLAAVQLLMINQSNFNVQRGMGSVQENGRFALDYINLTARSAEYSNAIGSTESGIITDASELPLGAAITNKDAFISRGSFTALGAGNSDQLVVRQWVSLNMPNFRDCEGNVVPVGNFSVTRYFMRADTLANSTSALACDGGYYKDGDTTVTNYTDDGVVLLSTVDSFQVLYGVTSTTPIPPVGQRFPVRYMGMETYTAILPATDRPIISALRVGVLVRSSESIGANYGTPADISVLDATVAGTAIDDQRVHRLFTSTLKLRNAI